MSQFKSAHKQLKRSKGSDTIWAVLAQAAHSHPPAPKRTSYVSLQETEEQLAAGFGSQLRHQIEIYSSGFGSADELLFLKAARGDFIESFNQVLFALCISFPFSKNIEYILAYPAKHDSCIPAQNPENSVTFAGILIGTQICMKGVLVCKHRMPKQTIDVANNLTIDEFLYCLQVPFLACQLLRKILVLPKKLADGVNSGQNYLRFQANNYLDGRPALVVFQFSEFEEVGGTIEKDQVADPSEGEFMVVEHEVDIL